MNSSSVNSPVARGIFFGILMFVALTVAKFISSDAISYKTFLPGLAGGLAGGLAVYFLWKFFIKRK